ncbi:P-loop containing nucleoside triphosphate hydrolase protein [Punctularia strigosozonata HHB-11173 SS5]|uniref:P-loop containing nucleoside triphosphate hydrolase protein n=1 Tax=Punctularia strigosozonata (strain HHB-11173) TaxID=741275 RepID=UPI000441817B|nr:P-loop containing nucleoside triphosphate hydrolase protein [Punctularia strigosozonata HHB-11173 SS5]EIN08451.1 P-loop containing nucleoside triphosphate hydrolase protein [Punctularia strigosozonata HHB-11173 SS5]
MQALPHLVPPLLPPAPSWYPGHMAKFAQNLPALLTRTDVVLEVRDARLPLTSINGKLEGALQHWRFSRGRYTGFNFGATAAAPSFNPARAIGGPRALALASPGTGVACERIVIFNKRDLVPEWGLEPFRRAMAAKFPDQRVLYTSWHRRADVKALHQLLVNVAQQHAGAPELNVLVVGMPNVGKSSLLNALRNIGIRGPTPKAFQTSVNPGLTQALSTRVRLSESPLIYAYDSPGVMLPYLGKGDRGAERGVKFALIAGIKEGLYDAKSLAAYLLYRLNVLNPIAPAYLTLLPPSTPPTNDVLQFLEQLADRLRMLKRGGEKDVHRAATWFINWWRDGALASAAAPSTAPLIEASTQTQILHEASYDPTSDPSARLPAHRVGWGFDLEWTHSAEASAGEELDAVLQRHMEECIERYVWETVAEEREGGGVSKSQEKRRVREEKIAKRLARVKRILGKAPTWSSRHSGR